MESDRQQRAPALESRETVAAKSSTIGITSSKKKTALSSNIEKLIYLHIFFAGAAASRQPSHLISLLPAVLLLCGVVGSWSWPPDCIGS